MAFKLFEDHHHLVRQLLENHIKAGDTVIDATCGNGHDTLFLSRCVAQSGCVIAYDIQQSAIAQAKKHIANTHDAPAKHLWVCESHCSFTTAQQLMDRDHLPTPSTIIFNTGYLPGGDHRITTTAETTLMALNAGLTLLEPQGLMCLTVYAGHDQGCEHGAIMAAVANLPGKYFSCLSMDIVNRRNAPTVIGIEKRA